MNDRKLHVFLNFLKRQNRKFSIKSFSILEPYISRKEFKNLLNKFSYEGYLEKLSLKTYYITDKFIQEFYSKKQNENNIIELKKVVIKARFRGDYDLQRKEYKIYNIKYVYSKKFKDILFFDIQLDNNKFNNVYRLYKIIEDVYKYFFELQNKLKVFFIDVGLDIEVLYLGKIIKAKNIYNLKKQIDNMEISDLKKEIEQLKASIDLLISKIKLLNNIINQQSKEKN